MLNCDAMQKLTFPVIEVLSDGQFHSGEQLAQRFGVSRATIFNAIKDAESLGIRLFSVRGKGYRLPQALKLLSVSEMQKAGLSPELVPLLAIHPVLDSSNQHLRQTLDQPYQRSQIVACHLQTAGRGRRGRLWQSQLGESLTFSMSWQFQCGAAELSGLSLSIGSALLKALHQLGYDKAQLKWPNDVVVVDDEGVKKIAGILIELQGDLDGPSVAIIGIGINLNLSPNTHTSIDQLATDLRSLNTETATINPNTILAATLNHMNQTLQQYQIQGFAADKAFWQENNAFKAKMLTVLQSNGSQITGTMQDIQEDGSLVLKTDQGLKTFHAGEISLRSM